MNDFELTVPDLYCQFRLITKNLEYMREPLRECSHITRFSSAPKFGPIVLCIEADYELCLCFASSVCVLLLHMLGANTMLGTMDNMEFINALSLNV